MVVEGENPGQNSVRLIARRGAGGGVLHEAAELDGAAQVEAVARPTHAVAREVALQPARPPPQRLHEPRHGHVQAQPRRGREQGRLPRPRRRHGARCARGAGCPRGVICRCTGVEEEAAAAVLAAPPRPVFRGGVEAGGRNGDLVVRLPYAGRQVYIDRRQAHSCWGDISGILGRI